ncbi:glycoside hydrolase superfamily [Xylariaceae sp. FL0255]|nr:glycoside hydrolase superfamily [Xylariaceae sp. FL0255]
MTTFTKIHGDETPLIEVDAAKRLSKIDPMIYGGFTEHMGRCIYGGIYDPGNSLSDTNGFRKDVIAALRELSVPVIRYPGGNFTATYHWQDGIGPRENRPSRPELAWLGVETNHFGTDEFMLWLEELSSSSSPGNRVEPYICLNMGTGTLDEALAWVEYCNGTQNTHYANLRRSNGHEAPYNVKYWALGNEIWGPWQVEQMSATDYAKKATQWAKALRLLDPNIVLVLCGQDGNATWDFEVLQACVHLVDMHSIHMYTAPQGHAPPPNSFPTDWHLKNATNPLPAPSTSSFPSSISQQHLKNVTAPLSAETSIKITSSLISLSRITNGVPASKPPTKICFDEWNVWDPLRAPGDLGAEETYTLSDSLAVAVWLNVFVRQSAYMGMACLAQSVNVISTLMTTPNGIVKQATWYPLLLFTRYMRGTAIATHVRSGVYSGPTQPAWLEGSLKAERDGGGAPWLDVSAAVDEKGYVSLSVVNISDAEDFETEIKGVESGREVAVYTVTAAGLTATNTEANEEVGLHEGNWSGEGVYRFPKHSFTMLRWKSR